MFLSQFADAKRSNRTLASRVATVLCLCILVSSPGQGAVAISVLRVLVPTVWEMQTKDGIEASGGRWAKLLGLLAGIQLEMPPSVG